MREILFRGKRDKKYNREQEWTYGVPYIDNEGDCIMADSASKLVVQSETVGQYIGLTDKNGKKIFEGDIVKSKVHFIHGYKTAKGVIVYEYDGFKLLVNNEYKQITYYSLCKVIGNIHDNPELLKGGAE